MAEGDGMTLLYLWTLLPALFGLLALADGARRGAK